MKNNREGKAAALTAEQFAALLEVSAPRYRALWAVQRWSAARIGQRLAHLVLANEDR